MTSNFRLHYGVVHEVDLTTANVQYGTYVRCEHICSEMNVRVLVPNVKVRFLRAVGFHAIVFLVELFREPHPMIIYVPFLVITSKDVIKMCFSVLFCNTVKSISLLQ